MYVLLGIFIWFIISCVISGIYIVDQNERAVVIPGLAMKIGMFLVRITPMPILRLAWRFGK